MLNTNGNMATQSAATAADIAQHYRPGTKGAGGFFRMPCPAHRGEGDNLAVADAQDGGLILTCHSVGCTYKDILDALKRDGLTIKREWTYPNGKSVTRTDRDGAGKSFKSPGTTKGVPLLIRGDADGALLIICEGEHDADAILSSNLPYAVACYPGGAGRAGDADYGAVNGRRVAVWPDHDAQGIAGADKAAAACIKAGAISVHMVPPVGKMGDGAGDVALGEMELLIEARRPFVPVISACDLPHGSGIVWTSITDVLAAPPAEWLVDGLMTNGGVTLLYGGPKMGKTMFMLGLLKAAATGGHFLDSDLGEPKLCWLFTEQSERSLAAQMRMMKLDSDNIRIALWRHQPQFETPDAFADAIYKDFMSAPQQPALLVIDTLGTFIDLKDINDYSQVTERLAPIAKMGQNIGDAEGTATLLIHHARKSGGEGSVSSLGSQKVAGVVDTLLQLRQGDGDKRKLGIWSRFGEGALGPAVDITLDLATGEYAVVDSAREMEEEIVATVAKGEASAADIRTALAANGVELGKTTLSRYLGQLVDSGRLLRKGKGPTTTYLIVRSPRVFSGANN